MKLEEVKSRVKTRPWDTAMLSVSDDLGELYVTVVGAVTLEEAREVVISTILERDTK